MALNSLYYFHRRKQECSPDDADQQQPLLWSQKSQQAEKYPTVIAVFRDFIREDEVIEKLRQQRDILLSELHVHWQATNRNPSDHMFARERHLKGRYQQKVDELMDAVHRQNILMYRWLEGGSVQI